MRYKDFTTHNHANEFVRELLVFFAAIPRNLVHNFLWHTIWKAKFTIVGKGCIKERKWATLFPLDRDTSYHHDRTSHDKAKWKHGFNPILYQNAVCRRAN